MVTIVLEMASKSFLCVIVVMILKQLEVRIKDMDKQMHKSFT